MFLYVSVMFRSLLSILCFTFCFILIFCYVWQFALYFMFFWCVLCYVSVLFCSLLSTLCYWSLCMFCFQYVSQFAFYLMFYVLFYVCLLFCFCLKSELCCVFVLCFCYVSVFFFFSVMFLIKIGLCLVFLCFCYVCYVDLFSLCFLLCFHSVLQSFFCSICIMLNSDLFSSVFLLGFCSYVSTKFALPFGNPSNLPSQLASELGSLQLVSQVCRGKTSWTNTGQFRPVGSFDHLSRDVFKFSAQQDCIGRRTASRHQAPPSMTPVWKPLDSKETVSTKWANLGDRSKRCFGPKLKMCSRSVKVCGIKVGNIITHMKSYDVSCFSLFMMFFDVIWFA